jgi:hypothetical protein
MHQSARAMRLLLALWEYLTYYLQIMDLFLLFRAKFVPCFYIPTYAGSVSMSVDMSFYLTRILNAGSLFGRLLGGALAE